MGDSERSIAAPLDVLSGKMETGIQVWAIRNDLVKELHLTKYKGLPQHVGLMLLFSGGPWGSYNKMGQWIPDVLEVESCCKKIRKPTPTKNRKRWPPVAPNWQNYLTHCKTVVHVANLLKLDAKALKRAVRRKYPPERRRKLACRKKT